MEKEHSYEELILAGIKGLPQDLLAEVADFVYVVRKRFTQPQVLDQELELILLPPSEAPDSWQGLAGTISPDDLRLMSEAIEAGCEQVDLSEW